MMRKLTLSAAVAASLGLLPTTVLAQSSGQSDAASSQTNSINQVTLGIQWEGGSNTGLYGRYNGFTDQGVDLLGGFEFSNRDPWDTGGTSYYDFTGSNLDLQTGDLLTGHFKDNSYRDQTDNNLGPDSSVGLDIGDQGTWGATLGYRAISYTGNIIDSIYTVNGSQGVLNFNLPPWGGATNVPPKVGTTTSFTTTSLAPYEEAFQVGTRRDILQLAAHYLFDDWTIASSIRHEHKEGSLEDSLRETYGGQAFALPVDFDTDRFDLSAAYQTPDLQAVLQYTYMSFKDNILAVSLPYPVSTARLSATSGPYAQTGLYSLPPSNSAHYVTAMLGDNLAPGTRLTLNGRFGVETQNSGFPANSADPNLSSTLGNPTYTWFQNLNGLNEGTSASSPDDVAWIYQGNFALASNLAQDLDGQMSYSFDGRSVHLNQYEVWEGGASPDATASTAVFVVPQDWFNQTAKLEGTYRILPENNTKLTVDYAFNDINRTNAQVEHSVTNTESVLLSSMIVPDLMGSLSYEHADRNGTLVYGTAWGNLEGGSPEFFGTPSGAYYQAPMTSNAIVLRAVYAPEGSFSGGLYLKYVGENYHYPAIPNTAPSGDWTLIGHGEGISSDYNLTVGPDINYRPQDDLDLHFYYTYERIYFDNLGNGACAESNTGTCAGSVGYFQNTYSSGMNTAGFNGTWQVNDDIKLDAEYNFSVGSVIFGEFNGVMVTSVTQSYQNVSPYPDINSVMHDLRLTVDYKVLPNVEWAVIYQFDMFHNNDWDYTGMPIVPTTNTGTAISILTPGYSTPNYNVSTIGTVIKVNL